jgi:hypothetical protein
MEKLLDSKFNDIDKFAVFEESIKTILEKFFSETSLSFNNEELFNEMTFAEGGLIGLLGGQVLIVPTDNFDLGDAGTCSKGVYMPIGVIAIRITGFSFSGGNSSNSWNELEDKPFGEVETYGSATVSGNSILWDGNTSGLTQLVQGLYKISSYTPSFEVLTAGVTTEKTMVGGTITTTETSFSSEGIIYGANMFTIITDTFVEGDLVASPGIYVVYDTNEGWGSSITFKGTDSLITTIDPKYLPADISGLPEVTTDDNGKVMKVVEGEWVLDEPIPDASTATEGAFLRVVDGAWAAVTLSNAEDGEF